MVQSNISAFICIVTGWSYHTGLKKDVTDARTCAQTGETNCMTHTKKVGFPPKFVPSSHYCHPVLTSKNKTHRFFLTYKEKAKLVCLCVWSWHISVQMASEGGGGFGDAALCFKYFSHQFSTTRPKQPLVDVVHTPCVSPTSQMSPSSGS